MSRFPRSRRRAPAVQLRRAAEALLDPRWRQDPLTAPRPGVWSFTIPGHVARINELLHAHWGTAAALKARDRRTIGLSALAAGVPRAAGKRRVTLGIVLGPRQRGGDPDAYHKSALDALVHCGMLIDDSPRYVELAPVAYTRGHLPETIICLEDLP